MTSPTPSTAPFPAAAPAAAPAYLLPPHHLDRVQSLLAHFDSVNLLHEAEHHTVMRNVVGSILTEMTGNAIAPMGDVVAMIRAQVAHFNESRPKAEPPRGEPIHDGPSAGEPDPEPATHDDGKARGYGTFIVATVGHTRPRKVVPVYGFVEHWPRGRKVFTGADYDAKHAYRIESEG